VGSGEGRLGQAELVALGEALALQLVRAELTAASLSRTEQEAVQTYRQTPEGAYRR
jgi:hypothetical protein